MFLDDELLKMCEDANVNIPDNLQLLHKEIFNKCENYYKSKIKIDMPNKEAKVILDKTFNLYDSFIRMALKSKNQKVRILAELFEKHSFRTLFLSDDKMGKVYKQISTNQ